MLLFVGLVVSLDEACSLVRYGESALEAKSLGVLKALTFRCSKFAATRCKTGASAVQSNEGGSPRAFCSVSESVFNGASLVEQSQRA